MKLNVLVISILFYTSCLYSQSRIERAGDYVLVALPLTSLVTTYFEKDFEGSKMFVNGAAFNLIVTLGLKELINKERPNGQDEMSFPSGHTSVTFQSAAFLHQRYGLHYGLPAYLLASYTAYSRVYAQKHFVEDVLFGAFVGIFSSYLFTQKRIQKQKMYFTLGKKGDYYKVNFAFKF